MGGTGAACAWLKQNGDEHVRSSALVACRTEEERLAKERATMENTAKAKIEEQQRAEVLGVCVWVRGQSFV